MSIDTFIANFSGGARPNRYRVIITYPTAVGTPNVRDEILCRAAGMPSSNIGMIPVPYKGRTIPVPGDRVFEDWTATFFNDVSMSHRNTFERWSNLIMSHEGNIQETNSYKDLLATIDVSQLDRKDNVVKTVRLLNAFPTMVTQIDLAYDANDIPSEFSVSFAYSHWEDANTTS